MLEWSTNTKPGWESVGGECESRTPGACSVLLFSGFFVGRETFANSVFKLPGINVSVVCTLTGHYFVYLPCTCMESISYILGYFVLEPLALHPT